MKRVCVVIGLFLLFISSNIFGKGTTGLGIYGNIVTSGNGAFGTGLGLTLKFGNFPVLGLEWMFGPATHISVSCDYWVINSHLGGLLDYYLGVGGFVGILAAGDTSAIDFGARIPIGLQIWPVNKFEVFAEIAPLVGFLPTLSLGIGIRLGFRVHF